MKLFLPTYLFIGLGLLWQYAYPSTSLCYAPISDASGNIFQPAISFSYGAFEPAQTSLPRLTEQDSISTKLELALPGSKFNNMQSHWRFAHNYRAFDFEEPANNKLHTNGDHHQLAVHWYGSSRQKQQQWLFGVAPLLSVTSNQLKNTGRLNSDAWQLHAVIEYRKFYTKSWQWLLGVCLDDRFDHFKAYPLAGVVGDINAKTRLRLAFPDSNITVNLAPGWHFSAALSPAGSKWDSFNKFADKHSVFNYRSWQFSLAARWQFKSRWHFTLKWGREFDRRFTFRQVAGNKASPVAESINYVEANITWQWRQ